MAMNKARRTANLNNILTYDTLGNSTLIANLTVEGLTDAGFVKADANGLLSVDINAYITLNSGLTGFTVGAATPISATDTVLQAFGKIQGQLNAIPDVNVITGTGTSGQVAYFTGATTQAGDANFIFDATNDRLILGGGADTTERFQVTGTSKITGASSFGGNMTLSLNQNAETKIQISNTTTGTASQSSLVLTSNTSEMVVTKFSSTRTTYKTLVANDAIIFNGSAGDITIHNDVASGNIKFAAGGSSTAQMTLHNSGNLLLGQTSNSGQRLQVTGDTLLKGSGNTSATTALSVQDSGGANMLRLLNDTTLKLGSQNVDIFPTANGSTVANAGRGLIISTGAGTQGTGAVKVVGSGTQASGNDWSLWLSHTFAPFGGTATHSGLLLNQTINQTGGANGITRGLYVQPTLTAASDWRSIEWSNNTGWGLYGAGTAQNYLAGNLGIGTTTLSNSALRVNKAITGAVTQSSIANSSTINSDVTTAAWMYVSSPSTQATAFTISEITHFNAFNLTIGAGSTVTNNFGFRANSNLTGATNNYGFYGDLAAATGRWNLYMNGTANNYMAGNLGLGLTPTHRLSIGDVTLGTGAGAANEVQFGRSNANAIFRAGQSGTNSGAFAWIYNATAASAFLEIGTFGNANRIDINGSQLRLNPSGNVIVGSTSDTGEKLQVTGTAKITGASSFGGNMTLSLNQNAATQFTISNTTAGASSSSNLQITSDSSSGNGAFGKRSSSTSVYKTLASSDLQLYNGLVAGDISILNDFASGSIKFAAGGSSTAQLTIAANGNITQSINQNAATQFTISNTTAGTFSAPSFQVISDSLSGSGLFGKRSSSTTAYKTLAFSDLQIYNGTVAGDISILNDFATGNIKFAAGGSSTAQMTLNANGNLTVDTDTLFVDSVNNRVGIGTTTVNSNLVVFSSIAGAPSTTNKGSFQLAFSTTNGLSFGTYNASPFANYIQSISHAQGGASYYPLALNPVSGAVLINTNTSTGESLQVNGAAKITSNLAVDTSTLFVDATTKFVGIGTAIPGTDLDIINTSTPAIRLRRNAGTDFRVGASTTAVGAILGTYTASPLIFYINGGTAMTLSAAGNLGVGSAPSPSYRLDVNGNTRISGGLLVTGTVSIQTLAGSGTGMVVTDNAGNLSTQPTSTYISSLTGEVSTTGSGTVSVTLGTTAVTGKALTGLSITSGAITSSDTILTAFGKIQGQINGLSGGSTYKGSWNASTNTPTITSGTGTAGDYYIVSTAGTTTIDGVSSWDVGDWIIFNGTIWQKIDNTDSVTSVNGQVGAVVLTTENITEVTNLYYTDARARAAISLTTSGSSGAATYSGGVLNIPNYTLSGLGGVSSSTILTINGTSLDLSSNRNWDVGTVTSVNASVPTGFTVGSAVTSSGNIDIGYVAGYALPTIAAQSNWDSAFNDKINSASVTGTTTKTLTLTQQDGGTVTASWSDLNTDAVTSVFGRTGAVVATSGDYTTAQVTESGNLYFTNARAIASTLTGYVSGAGTITSSDTVLSAIQKLNGNIAALVTGVSSVNGSTGAVTLTTTNISEGTNLYYTEARVNANTNVAANTAARHSAVTLGTANGLSLSTQQLSLGLASSSTNGALSSTDWNTFNGKQNALTNPVTGTGTTNFIPKFTGSTTLGNSILQEIGNIICIGAGGSAAEYALEIGTGRSGNGYAYLDLIGDTTYTDYGLRVIRMDAGPNSFSKILHRGTGQLEFITEDVANIAFFYNASATMTLSSSVTIHSLAGSGTRMVVADSSGVLSTQAIPSGGGTPGGSSGQVQYNSSGTFAGSANFLWDASENGMRIGYASSQGSTYKLQVNGSVYATSYFESSDITHKNVIDVNPNVNLSIDVVKFTRKGDNDVRYGYSAQQIMSIAPELVNNEGALGVKYIDVHTLKIAALEREIKELKNKLNALV
jgi:hypothetical protein